MLTFFGLTGFDVIFIFIVEESWEIFSFSFSRWRNSKLWSLRLEFETDFWSNIIFIWFELWRAKDFKETAILILSKAYSLN